MLRISALLVCISSALNALDTKPWLGPTFGLELQSDFSYSWFSKIEGASVQPSSTIRNRDIFIDLSFTPFETVDVQLEGEFGQTNHINWSLRSGAFQVRKWLMDDISGESPVSLTCGFNLRGAPVHFLKSVTTPYASEFNAELTGSVGKEWSCGPHWFARTWGFLAIGQGNRGYPWTRALLVGQYNLFDIHRFTLFTESLIGYGSKQHVNVDHFKGWGKYQHQSIDIGASYGVRLGVWGIVTATYSYRLFAHNYPEHSQFCMISYSLPFSVW